MYSAGWRDRHVRKRKENHFEHSRCAEPLAPVCSVNLHNLALKGGPCYLPVEEGTHSPTWKAPVGGYLSWCWILICSLRSSMGMPLGCTLRLGGGKWACAQSLALCNCPLNIHFLSFLPDGHVCGFWYHDWSVTGWNHSAHPVVQPLHIEN